MSFFNKYISNLIARDFAYRKKKSSLLTTHLCIIELSELTFCDVLRADDKWKIMLLTNHINKRLYGK